MHFPWVNVNSQQGIFLIYRFKQLKGYNVLFPFAFHCTGMPITAAANRLKKEILQFGINNLPTEKSS